MEPISAAAVTGLLVTFAGHLAGVAGGVLDEKVKKGLAALWDKVTARFAADPAASGALDRLAAQPDNARRQAAVEDHLDEALTADPQFAAALTELARAAGPEIGNVQITDAGAVAIGGNVEIRGGIAAGRDIRLRGNATNVGSAGAATDG